MMVARVPLYNPISCCIYLKFSALKLKKKKRKRKGEMQEEKRGEKFGKKIIILLLMPQ